MTQTVTTLYDTYNFAVSAVNALEAGVPHSDISIVSNNVDNRYTKDRPTHAAEDAGKGAGIGAAVGGIGGLLTGLGLLAIPGVGPVVAAGWLVATAAGAVTGAVVGGAAGGLVGSLTGAGVPEHDAHFYAEGVRRGGTLVTARVDDARASTAEKSYNSTSRWTRPFLARHTGKAAGLPSTKTRRLTLPNKSRRSVHAIPEAAFRCTRADGLELRFCPGCQRNLWPRGVVPVGELSWTLLAITTPGSSCGR